MILSRPILLVLVFGVTKSIYTRRYIALTIEQICRARRCGVIFIVREMVKQTLGQ